MARHEGRGMASVNYPIGMNLGGDPSQALIHSNPDGKFTVALSAIDLGQGMKQVSRQIAAETLGVPIEDVYVDTADSDTGPHDMGSFASRGTHRMGNAIIVAAGRQFAPFTDGGRRWPRAADWDATLDLAGRVNVRHDPALDRRLPAERVSRVTVDLDDGASYTMEQPNPIGDADHEPFGPLEVRDKLRRLIGADDAQRILDVVAALPAASDGAAVLGELP